MGLKNATSRNSCLDLVLIFIDLSTVTISILKLNSLY